MGKDPVHQPLSKLAFRVVLAGITACAVLLAGAQVRPLFGQELSVRDSLDRADTLIASARMDLGLSFNEDLVVPDSTRLQPSVDYTDAESISDRLRILTKELAASGRYSKAELLDIKLALSEVERDLDRLPKGAQRSGREAVERYFAILEAM